MVEIAGPIHAMTVGGRITIEIAGDRLIPCEIVGFEGEKALALPFGTLDGVRRGCKAVVGAASTGVRPTEAWLGRVVNALGEPVDGLGPLPSGPRIYPFRALPPSAHARRRVGAPLDLGVRSLNTFATCCRGQRMGIFAGSGVGKSVLLSMLARNVASGVSVIGLVGERGREVQEFLQDDLGETGLALMMGTAGAGAFCAALLVAYLGDFRRKGWFVLGGAIMFGICITGFAVSSHLNMSLMFLFGLGFALVCSIALTNTLLQKLVTDQMRGRVMSMFLLSFMGTMPIGNILAGTASNHFGPQHTLAFGGIVVTMAATGVLIFNRRLRELY